MYIIIMSLASDFCFVLFFLLKSYRTLFMKEFKKKKKMGGGGGGGVISHSMLQYTFMQILVII